MDLLTHQSIYTKSSRITSTQISCAKVWETGLGVLQIICSNGQDFRHLNHLDEPRYPRNLFRCNLIEISDNGT